MHGEDSQQGNTDDDKQLSDSDLTLGEIEKVVQSFINTLQGVYHERIKYPKMDEKMKKK